MRTISELKPDDYFAVYNEDDSLKGYYRLMSIHVTGKTVTYRTANWYERLWLHVVAQCFTDFPRFQWTPREDHQ